MATRPVKQYTDSDNTWYMGKPGLQHKCDSKCSEYTITLPFNLFSRSSFAHVVLFLPNSLVSMSDKIETKRLHWPASVHHVPVVDSLGDLPSSATIFLHRNHWYDPRYHPRYYQNQSVLPLTHCCYSLCAYRDHWPAVACHSSAQVRK
jgi:hypothetical protein